MKTAVVTPSSQEYIKEQANSVKYWRHSIDLGQGIITPGTLSHEAMEKRLSYIKIPENLSGKSVIDIGAWDGFFSFECEQRGAARVLAADHHVWHKSGMDGFQCAQKVLASKVEAIDITVEDLSRNIVGEFDVCLFLDVLYHLKKPMFCLERIAEITKEMLILETLVYRGDPKVPSMRFFETGFAGDATNWWAPNLLCLEQIVRASGFRRVGIIAQPEWKNQRARTFAKVLLGREVYGRCTIHAWK